jgi:hypothetical protein
LLEGRDDPKRLTALFDACFRIQREACEAAGRHIPMIVENVRGAQPWVGQSRWNYGSFHLWGDVPALMPKARAVKTIGHTNKRDGHAHSKHLTNPLEHCDCENPEPVSGVALVSMGCPVHNWTNPGENGTKQGGDWFNKELGKSISRRCSSKSKARKAASAQIAKIPLPLSTYIARTFKPEGWDLV